MIIDIHKVKSTKLTAGKLTVKIAQGLLILVNINHEDTELDADYLAAKLMNLKLFDS